MLASGEVKFMMEMLGILSSLVEDCVLQSVNDFMSGGMQLFKTYWYQSRAYHHYLYDRFRTCIV